SKELKDVSAMRGIGTKEMLSRVLVVLLAFILTLTTGVGSGLAQSLRERADRIGMLVGTAVAPQLFAEPGYAETLAREFNMLEPENVMKWAAIRPNRDTFNFKPGDQVVEFAKAHDQKVRGHCLLWHKYNPAWLSKGNFTADELSPILEKHITTVVKHYAGEVFAWDVVNEAFDAKGGMEHSIWLDQPGIGLAQRKTAYIEQAFRWARAADSKALLFYNDYDAEGLNAKSDAIYAMVKDFKKRGVPIDGVGIQAHIFNLSTKDISSLSQNMARLVGLGVQIHITEMDVALPIDAKGSVLSQSDLMRQAEIYEFVAKACLRQPGCTTLQTWGFTDKHSWIPGFTKGAKGMALLFDQNYAPKSAYKALLDVLRQERRL
ncbi:MAG: endo-1,4-beta-xylanase, partial [Acidobacteriota bacterium]|nr:endo-1,4-beta-xylanase [Acidobacteriota bacterium]